MVTPRRVDLVDISHYQSGTIGWAAARKAGVRAMFHKATQGTSMTDARYAARRAEAKKNGMPFGAYHYATTSASAAAQAEHFLAVAKPAVGDLRPMLDFENDGFVSWSVKEKSAFVSTFVSAVLKATGVRPFVYMPGSWALSSTYDCPLWVPRYSDANTAPKIPKPWTTWTVWQFSNGAAGVPKTVAGFGAVDLDTVNMDPAEFVETFTIPGKATAAKPTTTEEDDIMALTEAQLATIMEKAVSDALWDPLVPGYKADPEVASSVRNNLLLMGERVKQIEAQNAAVIKAIEALSTGLDASVQKAVTEALKGAIVDVDVNVAGGSTGATS